jgi:LysM repeat protein
MENFKTVILQHHKYVDMTNFKYLISLFVCFFILITLLAQTDDYMVHTIKANENLSLLAKQFHTTVGDIMRLNGMNDKSILKIGQKIKIPIKNTVTEKEKPVTPVAVPATTTAITHTVVKGESLYGIGKQYHVTQEQLKQWNNLKDANVKIGQLLVVGISAVAPVVKPEERTYMPARPGTDTATKKVVLNESVVTPVLTTPVVKPEEKTYMPARPANDTATKMGYTTEMPVIVKDEPSNNKIKNVGYFENQYSKGAQEIKGDAATFKSSSGWSDRKYYILMNNIDAGTIVKITVNNKFVYAKVLGALPEIKEDNGLLLRLSNAAASELGVTESKFMVIVNY